MFQSALFESVFLEAFKERWGIKTYRTDFPFTELVVLSVIPPDSKIGKFSISPKDAYRRIVSMFHPFPAPLKEPTFYEILRGKMVDAQLVKPKGATMRKTYAATAKGRIQLQNSIVELAQKPENADEAMLVMHLALEWADLLKAYRKISKAFPDSFWGFIGLPDGIESDMSFAAKPSKESKLLRAKVIQKLKEMGEQLLAAESDKKFEEAATHALRLNQANMAFFIGGMKVFEEWFNARAKQKVSGDDSLSQFSPIKDKLFAQMCREVRRILENNL